MPLPNDARKVRGTIERSINVHSLQHHQESGCSVTNECGVSHSAAPTYGRDGCVRITSCSASWSISHCNHANSAGDREVYEPTRWRVCALSAGHRLFDRRERGIRLGTIRPAGLRHVGPAAAALAAERFRALAHQFNRVEA
jgi:hypothetical protein